MADKPKPISPSLAGSIHEGPTLRPTRAPVVLVAGGPDSLLAAARLVAAAESPTIGVEACSAAAVAAVATSFRPFALVISQDMYGFDADEFTALARDVQAELIVLKVTRVTDAFLEQALRPSLRAAFRRYRSEVESGPVRK